MPRHVAIVMDGNGRWASRRGLSRHEGHRRGKDSVRAVVDAARELGIPYLTLYAFSSENWGAPTTEVSFLMGLFHRYLITETKRLMKRDIRVLALGDTERLPPRGARGAGGDGRGDARQSRDDGGAGAVVQRAPGHRQCGAIDRRAVADGALKPEEIDERLVARELATTRMPDPDLFIRTSGE